jgi:hypothetical protein
MYTPLYVFTLFKKCLFLYFCIFKEEKAIIRIIKRKRITIRKRRRKIIIKRKRITIRKRRRKRITNPTYK